jgi:hypothetical protein
MIRRPEDLPQKVIFKSKIARNEAARKTEIQVGGWDLTNRVQHRELLNELLRQTLTANKTF